MSDVIIETPEVAQEIIDLIPSDGQIIPKAFHYKVKTKENLVFNLTVIAPSATAARDGIKQQFPDSVVGFIGISEKIMQVNDQTVL